MPPLPIYLGGISRERWSPILSIYLSREGWPPNYQSRVGWTHPLILEESIYLSTHLPILEEVANFTHLFRKGVATYIFILQGRITTYPFTLLFICLSMEGLPSIYISKIDGNLSIYFGGIYLPIYLPTYLGGNGHPPEHLGRDDHINPLI